MKRPCRRLAALLLWLGALVYLLLLSRRRPPELEPAAGGGATPGGQVITCFGFSVVSSRYVGFAVVALLVEVNSVFLHLRQILRMANQAVGTRYRLNSIINLGTYVVFRINTLAWMTRWLVLNRDNVPLLAYTLGSVGMAIMTVMNIVLFCRLLKNDFLKSSTRENKKDKEM